MKKSPETWIDLFFKWALWALFLNLILAGKAWEFPHPNYYFNLNSLKK